MTKDELLSRIRRTRDLSTLPEIYNKVVTLTENPKTSAATLASVISRDQTLTARILRVANSPVFKVYPEPITSITFAITLLGFKVTKNIVLSATIFEMFTRMPEELKEKVEELWKHAIGCAVASKVIGHFVNYHEPEELFVAGLLHDIGKIVELELMAKEFIEILEFAENNDIPIIEAENKILNYDHTYVGKVLCKEWNLAPQIIDAVELHHTPEKDTKFDFIVSCVHIGDVFARAIDLGSGGDNKVPKIHEKAWKNVGMNISMIEPALKRIRDEWKGTVALLFQPA